MPSGRVDPVASVGVAIGVASLAFGFVQFRPNRIADGTLLRLWQVATPAELALFLAVLVATILLVVRLSGSWFDDRRCAARGMAGNLLIVLSIVIAAVNARRLIPVDAPFGRVSFAPGFWLTVLAGYLLILSALREMTAGPLARLTVSLSAVTVIVLLALGGALDHLSLWQEYLARKSRFAAQLAVHMSLSLGATGLAVLIGIPLGILAFRRRGAQRPVFFFVNTVQTIPSLALFGLLIAPLAYLSRQFGVLKALGIEGIGWAPALIALTLYALLPIARNTYTSLKVLDPAVVSAGRGMGMSRRQLLFRVEIPLATPIILGGLRTSLVQAIGNTTVAALIGAGGFGTFIFQGLGQAVPDLILVGTIPVIVLAVAVDRIMGLLIALVTPRGIGSPLEEARA